MGFHSGKLDGGGGGHFLGHLRVKLELDQGMFWVRTAGSQAAGTHLVGWQALG